VSYECWLQTGHRSLGDETDLTPSQIRGKLATCALLCLPPQLFPGEPAYREGGGRAVPLGEGQERWDPG